jgi:VCBS repeat protein/ASPIC/UnbV protein
MTRFRSWAFVLAAGCVLLASSTIFAPYSVARSKDPGAATTSASPAVDAEVEDLARLCEAVRLGDHPFFGTSMLSPLRQRVGAPGGAPAERIEPLLELAYQEFRVGEVAESARRLEEALALAPAAGYGNEGRLRLKRFLAAANLRIGEDANCVIRHTSASCIFPIAGEGVHLQPNGARKAGDIYLEILAESPDDPIAHWLLNVARMASGDWPSGVPERFRLAPWSMISEAPFPRWHDVAPALGVASRDNAGGGVMDDFDGDGLLDLVSSTSDPCDGMKAFRNDGRGGFEDVTRRWGLAGQLGGLNLVHADYDGDGLPDLLVLRGGWWGEQGRMRKSLLRNDLRRPAGRFTDVTMPAGLGAASYPTQTAAWADYDRDGDLDLYVGAEPGAQSPFPSQLLQNLGDGSFRDVTAAAGVENLRFAKGVAWGDYDDDGDADLYVSNIGPNRLYRNEGDGTFVDVAESAGVLAPEGPSFASWFFDWDNDGDLDLFVADYGSRPAAVFASYLGTPVGPGHPLLYQNDGGRFRDVSVEVGLGRPALPMGSNYGDLDGDGWLDVYLGTGNPEFDSLMPNLAYRNDGGRRFQDVTFAAGLGHLQKGHGVAFGDLDNDGDQDIFEQMGGAYPFDRYANALYENPGPPTSWVNLRLVASRANTFAVGARLEVVVRDGERRRSIHLLAGSGGSFGGSSLQQEVGLGSARVIEAVRVRWPASGVWQTFTGVTPGRAWRLVEGRAAPEPVPLPSLRLSTGTVEHQH